MLSIERRFPLSVARLAGLVVCAAVLLPAVSAAQQPSTSREELIRKWDLDRDGKITDGEAEVARSRMRRARVNAELGAGVDPLTGRLRGGGEPTAGAPAAGLPEDDGGLILVPGTGDRGGRPLGLATEPPPLPRREREALPGNRAPAAMPPVPQAAARSAQPAQTEPTPSRAGSGMLPGRELTSRARVLPGGPPQAALDGSRQQSTPQPPRPGVIAGGATPGSPRPAIPAVRPGYGAGGRDDLNAGRLPAGLPAGVSPGRGNAMGAAAGARGGPEAPGVPGRRAPPGLSGARPSSSPPPLAPPPSRGGGAATTPRSTAVPRVPRPGVDNVYGR